MSEAKPRGKTARSPINGAEIPLGAHPGNTGGKKGRSGRKPEWLKDWCDDLLADDTAKQQVQAILRDKDHPAFATMWKAVSDRAHGRPKEHVDVTSGNKPLRFTLALGALNDGDG